MTAAWDDLRDALATSTPACAGDARFTAETGEHDADLRPICATCPILGECRAYAQNAPRNATWGYYGGILRRATPHVRKR